MSANKCTITSRCLLCGVEIGGSQSPADHLADHYIDKEAAVGAKSRLASHSDGEGFYEDEWIYTIEGSDVIARVFHYEPLTEADRDLPVLGAAP